MHSPSLAFIALGSNLGDSPALIRAAMDRMAGWSIALLRRSSLWETAPVDCPPDSGRFVNAAVALEPSPAETPETLLNRLLALEKEFGRTPKKVHNEPRPLDLDLIAFGNEVRSTPDLVLPHPRAHERIFVLQPLGEIAPDLVLPGQTLNVTQLLVELSTRIQLASADPAAAARRLS